MQMPLQAVVERHALADQAFAVIDEQSQIEFGTVELHGRERVDALPQRCAGDGQRVDAVGLAAPTRAATLAGHQRGRNANDAFAAADQKALKRARDMSAVLQRPHPLPAKATCRDEHLLEPADADLDGRLAHQRAGPCVDCGDGVRALVHVCTEHHHCGRPPLVS